MLSPETTGNIQSTVIESLQADPRIIVVGGREKIALETHPRNWAQGGVEANDRLHHELDIYAHPKRAIHPREENRLNNLLDSLVPELPNRYTSDPGQYTRHIGQDFANLLNGLRFGYLFFKEELQEDDGSNSVKLSTQFMIAEQEDPEATRAFLWGWQSERETCIEQTTRVRLFPSKTLLTHVALSPDTIDSSSLKKEDLRQPTRSIGEAAVEQALDAPALRG
jgi:hypothetical protein